MKKLFLSLISMTLAGSVYAQLNTFKEGDVISAEKMNENFESLINSNVLRPKSVNCDEGETINGAIEKGFNDITVSGTCNENLQYSVWVGDSSADDPSSDKLAPRFLKIVGTNPSTDKIVDASSNQESTISVTSGATLLLENLTVSGGRYGVNAQRNSNLYLSGVTIDSFTQRGVRIADSSWLSINESGATIQGPGSGTGVYFTTASSGWISSLTISGVARGIDAIFGSTVATGPEPYDKDVRVYEITASDYGVRLNNSRFLHYGGLGSITATSVTAVWVYQGVFDVWDPGALELHDLIGVRGIELRQSKASINNLKLLDFNNTGSGWNPALEISGGSSVYINGAEITGSTDSALVSIEDGSIMEIRDSTLTVGSAAAGIEASGSSRLMFRNSTISGSVANSLVAVSDVSSSKIQDSTIILESGQRALDVVQSSVSRIENSNLSGTATNELVFVGRVSNVVIKNGSNLSQTNSESPDVALARLSFLTVWADGGTSIGKVHCWYKSSVSADEGTVADLDPSCIEEGADSPAPGSLDDLQGTWKTACQADGDSFSTELLEVNETDATISVSIYPDSECTTAEALFTASISNLSVGEGIDFDDGSSGYKFSLIQQGLTITPLFDEMAAQFNQYSLCGKTDWAPNQSTEVMGLSCDFEYPAKDVIQYGAYKILGSSLYLGESSPTGYPPNVDGYPFVKQ